MSCWIPTPGWVTAATRNVAATASEQRPRTGMRFQSKPAKTPKMIARASTLAVQHPTDRPISQGRSIVQAGQQDFGVAVVHALDAQGDIAAPEAVQLPVARKDGLDTGSAQLVAKGQSGLQILEVAHDRPVVVGRVCNVDVQRAAAPAAQPAHRGGLRPDASLAESGNS